MATEIFISYSHLDRKYLLKDSLLGHLELLRRDGASFWDDRDIPTGSTWVEIIKQKISTADIVLALVSQSFLGSDYCQNTEIARALKRSRYDGLIIFPVILSACSWKQFEWLLQRQFLPSEGKNIEQHFTTPGKRKALFQRILDALREHVNTVEQTKAHLRSSAIKFVSKSVNTINQLNSQLISFSSGSLRRIEGIALLRRRR